MEQNLALQGPDLLKDELIVSASVPRVYEARKGTAFRVRTIASPIGIPPTVNTISGTSVISGSSVISASILAIGSSVVTTRGVCWNTLPNPTISNSRTIESGSFGVGPFTATTTGMLDNIVYFVRAYATNSGGTSYGSQISVTSPTAINIPTNTLTGWTVLGNVTTSGGSILVQSSNRTRAEIQTFLNVVFPDPASGSTITNGAAIRYNTQITLSSTTNIRFNWVLSGGDMGSTYRDRAYVVISGHSVASNNGAFFIADSLSNPLSGTFVRSISAGTFTFGFACFNWADTAVDATLTFNTLSFS